MQAARPPSEPLLEHWEVLPDGRYQGQVYGRPGYEDGDVITTGTVLHATLTHIATASGTTYALGRPNTRRQPVPRKPPPGTAAVVPKPAELKKDKLDGPAGQRPPMAGRRAPLEGEGPPGALAPGRPRDRRHSEPKPKLPLEADDLGITARDCLRDLYVGDRVRVKGTGETRGLCGDVMYIGPARFANGQQVCGVRLEEPQPGRLHDGRERGGERYFRCAPGHGCYVAREDVELLPRDCAKRLPDDAEPPFDFDQALASLVGMHSTKKYLRSLRNRLEVGRKREVFGVKDSKPLHTVLVGSQGMDVVSLAAVFGGIFQEAHLLPRRDVVVVGRKDLVGASSEATGKLCDEVVAKAQGGVLLLADVSGMACDARGKDKEDYYGAQALHRVLGAVAAPDPPRGLAPFVLLIAVRREGLPQLLQVSPTLAALALPQVELVEYSLPDTVALLRQMVSAAKFELDPELTDDRLAEIVSPHLSRCTTERRGIELAKRLVEEAIQRQTDRVFGQQTVSRMSLLQLCEVDFEEPPAQNGTPTADGLARLHAVVGLAGVKRHIESLVAQLQLDQERRLAGLPGSGCRATNLHMIFSGNPGTGKTTVARIISEVLQSMGILRCGHCVETDRADLVAGYVGQTALKVHDVVQRALGGVLFVDEAYALVKDERDQFGREALDTLMKLVEDHRDDLVVVLAGYPREMEEMIGRNPGVRSRFPTVIPFEDYAVPELLQIADIVLAKAHMQLGPGARDALLRHCVHIAGAKDAANGNGRAIRNVVEQALRNQAVRLLGQRRDAAAPPPPAHLCILTQEDLNFSP